MTNDALERLRSANPVPMLPTAGPAPVFDGVPQPQARQRPAALRSRRLLVLAFGVVVLGIGAAIAAARSGLWWNGARSPYAVQTSSAEKLVQFTLTSGISIWSGGTTIAMWRLPQDNGWMCYRLALASAAPTGPHDLGEGTCYKGTPEPPRDSPVNVAFSNAPGESWLMSGEVNPASGITELGLNSPRGDLPISYANGWFLAELPSGSGEKFPEGGPYVLVGRDSDGKTVAQVDLEKYYQRYHGSA